ncbi:MAG: hypothetical protein AAF581_19065 [Planctomycetota bacterium]
MGDPRDRASVDVLVKGNIPGGVPLSIDKVAVTGDGSELIKATVETLPRREHKIEVKLLTLPREDTTAHLWIHTSGGYKSMHVVVEIAGSEND